jgi:UDP-N-acetylglucosamine--N-acetylmuramyl-(pentapeptide) pyrophosphoryl-undecaprenol N-acetylglucosamine transferase
MELCRALNILVGSRQLKKQSRHMNQLNKRIILAGGGSGGPVAPLLAVATELKKLDPAVEFLFVGTKNGPEKQMVESAGIKFVSIPAAKFRRYFSLANFIDFFVFIGSLFAARRVLKEFKPVLIFGAGGYVAVPISWMGWFARIKIAMHQQDAHVGLANRMITPVADLATTALERTAKEFLSGTGLFKSPLKPAAEWTGNPIRSDFFTPVSSNALAKLGLNDSLPILLIVGGATGATQINEVVAEALPELVKSHQIIHITGKGKNIISSKHQNYHAYEFLSEDMPDAMKLADIVLTRAGLSTIAELSALGKISIVVPMPGTHQEFNAAVLKERRAAVVLSGQEFNAEDLPRIINSIKFNPARQKLITTNISAIMPHDAASRIAKLLLNYVS